MICNYFDPPEHPNAIVQTYFVSMITNQFSKNHPTEVFH